MRVLRDLVRAAHWGCPVEARGLAASGMRVWLPEADDPLPLWEEVGPPDHELGVPFDGDVLPIQPVPSRPDGTWLQ